MKKDKEKEKGYNICDLSGVSVSLFLVIFVMIIILPILVIKNFYLFCVGAIVNGFIIANYKLTRYIINAFNKKNYVPLKWFAYISLFIVVAVLFGFLLARYELTNKAYDVIINSSVMEFVE